MNKENLKKAFREAKKAAAALAVFGKYYKIASGAYSPDKCIIIEEF